MNPHTPDFLAIMRDPLRFKFFLLLKLPSAFFSGVRIREISERASTVTVPFTWFSKNPFRSTYFACLAMAAEMSTGVLALAHLYKQHPPVSMLVTRLEAQYFKKATGITAFHCQDGEAFRDIIQKAIHTGEAQTLVARSIGTSKQGEPVAEFTITWSFRVKATRS